MQAIGLVVWWLGGVVYGVWCVVRGAWRVMFEGARGSVSAGSRGRGLGARGRGLSGTRTRRDVQGLLDVIAVEVLCSHDRVNARHRLTNHHA